MRQALPLCVSPASNATAVPLVVHVTSSVLFLLIPTVSVQPAPSISSVIVMTPMSSYVP